MSLDLAPPLSKRRLKAWIRLLGAARAVETSLSRTLRAQGTTLPRFDVMAALWRRREGLTMTDLSRLLLVSPGNATAVVDRLEAEGLARRTRGADRRSVTVALTPEGLRLFESLALRHEAEVDRLLAPWDEADLDAASDLLRRLGAPR